MDTVRYYYDFIFYANRCFTKNVYIICINYIPKICMFKHVFFLIQMYILNKYTLYVYASNILLLQID